MKPSKKHEGRYLTIADSNGNEIVGLYLHIKKRQAFRFNYVWEQEQTISEGVFERDEWTVVTVH